MDFYKDDVSPVYCLPWDAIPELHEPINKLINNYTRNLPTGDLYYLHDKIPEFKISKGEYPNPVRLMNLSTPTKAFNTMKSFLKDECDAKCFPALIELMKSMTFVW